MGAADDLSTLGDIADAIDQHEDDLAMLRRTRTALWLSLVEQGVAQRDIAAASRVAEGQIRKARRAVGDTGDRRGGDQYAEYRARKAAEATEPESDE